MSLLAAGLLAMACASGPKQRPEGSARMKDTAPEKIAAQRAAAPGLQLEQDDARWGFEAARERRTAEAKQKQQQKQPQPQPATSAVQTGPVDLRQTPAAPLPTVPK